MNYNKKGISLIDDGTKKLSHQNTKIKFKQAKQKSLSKRKYKNFTPVEIHSTKKITIIQKKHKPNSKFNGNYINIINLIQLFQI